MMFRKSTAIGAVRPFLAGEGGIERPGLQGRDQRFGRDIHLQQMCVGQQTRAIIENGAVFFAAWAGAYYGQPLADQQFGNAAT